MTDQRDRSFIPPGRLFDLSKNVTSEYSESRYDGNGSQVRQASGMGCAFFGEGKKKQKIENKFQFYRPFKRVLEFIESGNFYFPRPKGKNTEVVINTAHPFYKKVYERATQNNMDVFLDLLLFTLAKADL